MESLSSKDNIQARFFFPGQNPACGPSSPILFSSQRHRPDCSHPLSGFSFPLSSLCSPPLIIQPRLPRPPGPFQRRIRAHLTIVKRTGHLSSCFSPLLQNKVAFKRRNSLRFCLPNREGPRGRAREHRVADSPALLMLTAKVWRDMADKAQGQARQQRRGGRVVLGPMAWRLPRSYRVLPNHTVQPLSFSRFSTVLTSLPMPHK